MKEFELYSPRRKNAKRSFATHYARLRRAAAGATFAALLESELSDSAMLGYLRPACCASCGTIGNLFFSANAKKAPIWVPLRWRRRRDLNSRAGITGLHP